MACRNFSHNMVTHHEPPSRWRALSRVSRQANRTEVRHLIKFGGDLILFMRGFKQMLTPCEIFNKHILLLRNAGTQKSPCLSEIGKLFKHTTLACLKISYLHIRGSAAIKTS